MTFWEVVGAVIVADLMFCVGALVLAVIGEFL